MDDKSKQTWDKCEALLTECKLIGVHIVGMQSRLELDMPVTVDMALIRSDLELIKGCVARLQGILMKDQTFECLRCGHCCTRIVAEGLGGTNFGLCLLPGEQKLFEAFPDAIVVPYIGLRKRAGKPRVETICYQMVRAPCPLYDAIGKTCTRYDERPSVCRSYPFSGMGDGYSLEQHCGWVKELGEVEFGKTVLRAGDVADAAIAETQSFFMSLHQRMQRTGERMVFYDVGNDVWLEISR